MTHIKGKFTDNQATRGWFVGDFFPDGHPAKTDKVEIVYFEHQVGEKVAPHKHNIKVEIVIILEGKARYTVDDDVIELTGGDYIFMQNGCVISAEFLKPTKLFAIHAPSLPTDKVVVETE